MPTSRAAWAVLLALLCSAPALAQTTTPTVPTPPGQPPPPIQGTTTTVETTTIAGTLSQIAGPSGPAHVGDALGLAAQLGVAMTPLGDASGGFLITLDPSTGLQVRAATTFGPAFAERALTSGEGKVSIGVNFLSQKFDRLDDLTVDNNLQIRSGTGATAAASRTGSTSLSLSTKTTVVYARMGVTDKFDVGVSIPMVAVKLTGTSQLRSGVGDVLFAQGQAASSGLGDVQGIAKYRFFSFGEGTPDPGGLAAMVTVAVPTGDKDQLRGLDVTRTMVTLIASGGRGRLRPHANGGFGYWSKGVSVVSDAAPNTTVEARHEYQFAGGLEIEASPKVTLLADLVGGGVLGGGRVGFGSVVDSTLSSSQGLVALNEGTRRLDLAPGLKANLKGKLLVSLNVLIALADNGLHSRVTPFAGIDLTF
jgi:hypothetical protein